MSTITLSVKGMTCGGCEESVRNAVGRIDGVRHVDADHTTGTVVVATDKPVVQATLTEAVEGAGFEVVG